MKKKILLTLSVLLAFANMFAQETVTKEGITLSYNPSEITVENAGSAEEDNDVTVKRDPDEYFVEIVYKDVTVTKDAVKTVNAKLTGVTGNYVNIKTLSSSLMSIIDQKTYSCDNDKICICDDNDEDTYTIIEGDDYDHYLFAMEIAADNDSRIKKGSDVINMTPAKAETDGYYICEGLYYILTGGKNADKATGCVPILAYSLKYDVSTRYENSVINYVPTTIAAGVIGEEVTSISIAPTVTTIEDGAFANSKIDSYSATNLFRVRTINDVQFLTNASYSKIFAIQYGATGKFNIPTSVTSVAKNCLANVSGVTLISTNISIENAALVGGTNNLVQTASATPTTVPTADGKGLMVTGVVTSQNVNKIDAGNASYVDFKDATIVGSLGTVTPGQPNLLYYFPAGTDVNEGNNIVIGKECINYVVTDNGKEIYVPAAFNADMATIKRKFTAGKLATVVLPFSTGDLVYDLKPATFGSYDPETKICKFIYASSGVAANTPFIANVQSTVSELTTGMVTVQKSVPSMSGSTESYLGGTYVKMVSSDFTEDDFLFSNGNVCKIGSDNYLNPTRAYLHVANLNSESEVKLMFIEEDEDGNGQIIDTANDVEKVEIDAPAVKKEFYTVDGKRIDAPQKGMNIVKKTLADGSVVTDKVVVK